MIDYLNPFEYEGASKFTSNEQILDFYIEDYNYSRFIRSRRNIILVGERGTGKSITLLFNSLPIQKTKADKEGKKLNLDVICIYIPCNTPLTHKKEFQLLDNFRAEVVSEHFLIAPIMYEIADTLSKVKQLNENTDYSKLIREIEYVIGIKLPKGIPFFESLKQAMLKEITNAQRAVNARTLDAFYEKALSFSSAVVPLLTSLKKIPLLQKSHFSLMIDDAHDLNIHQTMALNSWIAYRDNTIFSFKVAMAKADPPNFLTSSGGTILEGHDYTLVDLERPYQNKESEFGKLARNILSRRLTKIGAKSSPDKFFPNNPKFEKDIAASKKTVILEAHERFPDGSKKQINDFVYKYTRAEYFRGRSRRANLPPYSGLDTLVHLSTGVIRNFLEPCYWMYDNVISDKRSKGEDISNIHVNNIPYSVQNDVIIRRSKEKWDWLRDWDKGGLANAVQGCSREQAKQVYQLFDKLAYLFKQRLLEHKSEPRAITFTISETNFEYLEDLMDLLRIARKAQLLYEYSSSAKDHGSRETYYVPNRMLWPIRGLDPCGQHARVSLRARHLWAAAKDGVDIPYNVEDVDESEKMQGRLI